MAHANGAEVVRSAAEAGVDSVEHGAYLDGEALHAMAENGTVWVPTLSTIGNLRGRGGSMRPLWNRFWNRPWKMRRNLPPWGPGGRGQRCRGLGGPPCRRNGENTAHKALGENVEEVLRRGGRKSGRNSENPPAGRCRGGKPRCAEFHTQNR